MVSVAFAIAGCGTAAPDSLAVGDCIDIPTSAEIASIPRRACTEAHAGEVFHIFEAGDGAAAYPSDGEWAELILDFVHVEEGAALAALRAIPYLYCITDAVAATGMPPGEYRLGQHRIFKEESAVRLGDGTLAGSVLTMDGALRNLLHLGIPLEQAARRCATLPADHLGLADRGRLIAGAAADVVVAEQSGRLQAVLLEGRPVAIATD